MPAERGRALAAFLDTPRGAWLVLAGAMAASAALILHTTSGQTFDIDEIAYYGRSVNEAGTVVYHSGLSLEYLLAPFNGHLQLVSKLIYEALFATVGTSYTVFVLVNVAALCASVGLVFELLRRRLGPLAALAPCVLLLFLGFASEVLLWPFDMVTLISLAAGLGALLCLQRGDRRGDIWACLLLTLSIASVELGICFAIGAAVSVLWREDRLRRLWIFVVPLVLYGVWWLWAHHFHQSQIALSNLVGLPGALFNSLAAVTGALTGTDSLAAVFYTAPITPVARALAVVAILAALLRSRLRPPLPRAFWIWGAILLSYWVSMAFADRPPEAARYIFVGAVGFLLVGAEAIADRMKPALVAGICLVAVIALPANIEQLVNARDLDTLHADTHVSKAEYAMLELARRRVDPAYVPAADERVQEAGGGLFTALPAGVYLQSAERNGSLGYSLGQLRDQPLATKQIADASLVGAEAIALRPGARPRAAAGCPTRRSPSLRPGSWLIGAGAAKTGLALRRFAPAGGGVRLGEIAPHAWATLRLPRDEAREKWRLLSGAPVEICPGR